MKRILLISDLHLDDSIQNEYRWNIFKQIEEKMYKEEINSLYILGDITDRKDRHSAILVNKLIEQIGYLCDKFENVILLAGNHDYINQDLPFFAFHSQMFYGKPFKSETNGIKEVFLPHVKNPEEIYGKINISEFDIVFTHLDVKGAKMDNGMKSMEGLPVKFFNNVLTISGHIHTPQKIGNNFHYIGSPYSIIYENNKVNHRGIILTYDNGSVSMEDTYFEFPSKIVKVIKSKEDIPDTNDGNFYKFDIQVKDSELDIYTDIKDSIKDENIKLNLKVTERDSKTLNISKSTNYFEEYCKINKLKDSLKDVGKELMNEDQV